MDDFPSIERRASRIKLLLMDCDGVLTDGRLWLTEDGDEQKSFNTHDGLGLTLLHRAGLKSRDRADAYAQRDDQHGSGAGGNRSDPRPGGNAGTSWS